MISRWYAYVSSLLKDSRRPLCVIYGNCQAASLAAHLKSSPSFPFDVVSPPGVHEITPFELRQLRPLLRRTEVFVSQAVRSGYRGQALGSEELRELLPPSALRITYPTIYFEGGFPDQVYLKDHLGGS